MALPATVYRLRVALSNVDRAVYETLDLRVARYPSRRLLTRALAYCLCYARRVCRVGELHRGGAANWTVGGLRPEDTDCGARRRRLVGA